MELIYKNDAVDAVKNLVSSMSVCLNRDECNGMNFMKYCAIKALEGLEPVSSGIIKCKDCNHRYMFMNRYMCDFVDFEPTDDMFCSKAEVREINE